MPAELLARRRWVRHDAAKIPLRADGRGRASSTKAWTWSSHEEAVAATSVGVGLGYVLRAGDGVVCLDLDHVLDERGVPTAAAAALLARVPSTWTETSRSGRGVHVWGRGELPVGRRLVVDGVHLEAYGHARFIALGTPRPGCGRGLADISCVLDELLVPA